MNRLAQKQALVAVFALLAVIGLLGTSYVAQAILAFSGLDLTFVHNGLQAALSSVALGSSFDIYISNLTGGFIDMTDLTSVVIAVAAVMGILIEFRDIRRGK